MKKIFILFIFLFAPLSVFAVQGTCSPHGGVNCSAGYDYADGSSICNDGWKDSSEFFGDVYICKNNFKCTSIEYSNLKSQSNYNDLQMQIDLLTNQLYVKKQEYDAIPDTTIIGGSVYRKKTAISVEMMGVSNQIVALQTNQKRILADINDQCSILGQDKYNSYVAGAYQASINYQNQLLEYQRQEQIKKVQEEISKQNKEQEEFNRQMEAQQQIILYQVKQNDNLINNEKFNIVETKKLTSVNESNIKKQEISASTTYNTATATPLIKEVNIENLEKKETIKASVFESVINKIINIFKKLKFW